MLLSRVSARSTSSPRITMPTLLAIPLFAVDYSRETGSLYRMRGEKSLTLRLASQYRGSAFCGHSRGKIVKKTVTYASAGVNIDEGERMVSLIRPIVGTTRRREVLGGLGGVGGWFRFPAGEAR